MVEFFEVLVELSPLIGIAGALAWLWVTLFCLIKTKWKYAWSGVIILSVFDHFIWTQVAPWWWVLVGVSSVSAIKSDLIFRRVNEPKVV